MSIQKKSLLSTLKTAKKANIASSPLAEVGDATSSKSVKLAKVNNIRLAKVNNVKLAKVNNVKLAKVNNTRLAKVNNVKLAKF
jgi:hypothetical protein